MFATGLGPTSYRSYTITSSVDSQLWSQTCLFLSQNHRVHSALCLLRVDIISLFVFVTQRKIFLVLFTISHKFRVTRITGQLSRSKRCKFHISVNSEQWRGMISSWLRVNRKAFNWLIAVILTSDWLQGDFAQFHKLLQEGADVNHRHGEPLREAITNR